MNKRKYYNINDLHTFLRKAKAEKYKALVKKCENDDVFKGFEHGMFRFAERGFALMDKYCLGNPFTGQEIVCFQARPIWIMNYHGDWINNEEHLPESQMLIIVKMAIMATGKAGGVNGCIFYKKDDFQYLVENMGDNSIYDGKGYIYKNDKLLFRFTYYGGIVSD